MSGRKPKLVKAQIMPAAFQGEIPDWATAAARALLSAMRERDPYTYGHCMRVARYARLLAKATGLSEMEQRVIEFSSMFHDLGKMGIPDSILLKNGRLTDEEEEIMMGHPVMSENIVRPLAEIPFFAATLPGIRHHHERVDGEGYPDRIKGSQIPVTARVLLVADTFDAMTTTRPYRRGLSTEIAYKELKLFSGRQFDPQIVKTFLEAHPTWSEVEEEISEVFITTRFKKVA